MAHGEERDQGAEQDASADADEDEPVLGDGEPAGADEYDRKRIKEAVKYPTISRVINQCHGAERMRDGLDEGHVERDKLEDGIFVENDEWAENCTTKDASEGVIFALLFSVQVGVADGCSFSESAGLQSDHDHD